jgi:regulation of enolase protein 1 (concanavalin A-like superfamily)
LGLYDMHGNVWEWSADSDPNGPNGTSQQVFRGGSWRIFGNTTTRHFSDASWKNIGIGLRLARVPIGKEIGKPVAADSSPAVQPKKPPQIKGWGTVVDPAGDCKVALKNGKLTITVPGTHHNLNPTPLFDNVLAPRVLQEVEGDFTMQVKVEVFARPQAKTSTNKAGNSLVAAGLLVWQDEKNFVRFLQAAMGETGALGGSLEVYRDGKFIGGGSTATDDKATHLKLSRKGNAFSFAVSADGKDWSEIKGEGVDLGKIDLAKQLKVGVAAVNATTKEFAPQFEGLSLMAK